MDSKIQKPPEPTVLRSAKHGNDKLLLFIGIIFLVLGLISAVGYFLISK